jgi:hypothetical protein
MDENEKLDFFAGCALVGLLASGKLTDQTQEELVKLAYELAERMQWNQKKQ